MLGDLWLSFYVAFCSGAADAKNFSIRVVAPINVLSNNNGQIGIIYRTKPACRSATSK